MLPHRLDDDGPLQERVALVAGLLAHRKQGIAGKQALAQFVIHRRGWRPGARPPLGRELGQNRCVEEIGFGPPRQRLSIVMRLGRVDDTNHVAGLVQSDRESDPIGAGRLQHHQDLPWRHTRRLQLGLEGLKAGGGLRKAAGALTRRPLSRPRGRKCAGGNINADEELVGGAIGGRGHTCSLWCGTRGGAGRRSTAASVVPRHAWSSHTIRS